MESVYIKIDKCINVNSTCVRLVDVAQIIGDDSCLVDKLNDIEFVRFDGDKDVRRVFSIIDVIKIIKQYFPQVNVNNLGESDFVVVYNKEKTKNNSIKKIVLVVIVCILTFTGSAYGIIAYNNDVGAQEIFKKMYELVGANDLSQYKLAEVMYAIGLFLGLVIFYDHFAGHKITNDPTPLEVSMEQYDSDVADALIDRKSDEESS